MCRPPGTAGRVAGRLPNETQAASLQGGSLDRHPAHTFPNPEPKAAPNWAKGYMHGSPGGCGGLKCKAGTSHRQPSEGSHNR